MQIRQKQLLDVRLERAERFHEGVEIIGCTCCELPDYQKLEEAASVPARALYQCGLPRPSTTAL